MSNLTGLGITIHGTDAQSFSLTGYPAALHIASDAADENPFDLKLVGHALSFLEDTDSDGLNDAAESEMAGLGFDWQVSQGAFWQSLCGNSMRDRRLRQEVRDMSSQGIYGVYRVCIR